MMQEISAVIRGMIEYNGADVRRIGHALQVYALAQTIGQAEGLSAREQEVLETAAVLHDIGIHACEQKYGHCAGSCQQVEGPPIAEALLHGLAMPAELIARICYLIGHHHTYGRVDGADYRILLEADFLVNAYEDGMNQRQLEAGRRKIFKTRTGRSLLTQMYPPAKKEKPHELPEK